VSRMEAAASYAPRAGNRAFMSIAKHLKLLEEETGRVQGVLDRLGTAKDKVRVRPFMADVRKSSCAAAADSTSSNSESPPFGCVRQPTRPSAMQTAFFHVTGCDVIPRERRDVLRQPLGVGYEPPTRAATFLFGSSSISGRNLVCGGNAIGIDASAVREAHHVAVAF